MTTKQRKEAVASFSGVLFLLAVILVFTVSGSCGAVPRKQEPFFSSRMVRSRTSGFFKKRCVLETPNWCSSVQKRNGAFFLVVLFKNKKTSFCFFVLKTQTNN